MPVVSYIKMQIDTFIINDLLDIIIEKIVVNDIMLFLLFLFIINISAKG